MIAELTIYIPKGYRMQNGRWSHFLIEIYHIKDEDDIIGIKESIAINTPDAEIVLVEVKDEFEK